MKNLLQILFVLLLCEVVPGSDVSKGASADAVRDMAFQQGAISLHNSSSFKMMLNETVSLNLGVKVCKTSHHQGHIFDPRTKYSHSLNLSIAIHNACIVAFSRSVDKYIYALRHIII